MTGIDLADKKSRIGGIISGANALIYVTHITSFLETAAFALIWSITLEVYPKNTRMNGLGLCSGIGRLGAIMGIILGEYKWLHLSTPVKIVAGASTLISAFLILALPDLTKEKMPQTVSEIEAFQFSAKTSNQNQENNTPEMD